MSTKAKSTPKKKRITSAKAAHDGTGKYSLLATQNDLPSRTRELVIGICNQSLADLKDLQTQCKQAHWNVKGDNFIALHELFDRLNGEIDGYVDEVAERAVQLGGVALGTARVVAKESRLPEYPLCISDGEDHIDALGHALAVVAKSVRKNIDLTDAAGDADTADLFTGVSRGLDKALWFVEAHKKTRVVK